MRTSIALLSSVGLYSLCATALSPIPIPGVSVQAADDLDVDGDYTLQSSSDGSERGGITYHRFLSKVDHFDPSSPTFNLSYWVSDRYYKPGGPVIAFNADQTCGSYLLPSLKYGIADQILKETNGLGVIVEQRYFGKSIPVSDFSTKNLKWLTLEQTLQDYIYFSRNVDLGHAHTNSDSGKPWIWYGGGPAAFLRKRFPTDVLGAVASAATVHARVDFWQYWDQVRVNGGLCTARVAEVVQHLDSLIELKDQSSIKKVKVQFHLQNLTNHQDFMWVLSHPLLNYGTSQWNERQVHDKWEEFCNALGEGLGNANDTQASFDVLLGNYAKYIIKEYVDIEFATGKDDPLIENYSPRNSKYLYKVDHSFGIEQTWRAYAYLKCTEYGLHSAAAPEPYPSLFSRVIDLEYISYFCKSSFTDSPASIPPSPRVENINKYGGSGIAAENLLLVDGALNAWLGATAHDPEAGVKPNDGKRYWLTPGSFGSAEMFKVNPKNLHRNGPGIPKVTPPDIAITQQVVIDAIKHWLVAVK